MAQQTKDWELIERDLSLTILKLEKQIDRLITDLDAERQLTIKLKQAIIDFLRNEDNDKQNEG